MIGRVYKIIHNQSELIYIGSTINKLKYRWQQHKNNYKYWVYGRSDRSHCSLYKYFLKYGIENFKIILIKEYNL
mgnify:CR=1 FL=1